MGFLKRRFAFSACLAGILLTGFADSAWVGVQMNFTRPIPLHEAIELTRPDTNIERAVFQFSEDFGNEEGVSGSVYWEGDKSVQEIYNAHWPRVLRMAKEALATRKADHTRTGKFAEQVASIEASITRLQNLIDTCNDVCPPVLVSYGEFVTSRANLERVAAADDERIGDYAYVGAQEFVKHFFFRLLTHLFPEMFSIPPIQIRIQVNE
jgi:hypothetical protein